jgi:hypothetical protein
MATDETLEKGRKTKRRGAEVAKDAQRKPVAAVIPLARTLPVLIQQTFPPIKRRYP